MTKPTVKRAAAKTGLTAAAVACIAVGIKLAEKDIGAGSILIVLGIAMFVVNYYFGEK